LASCSGGGDAEQMNAVGFAAELAGRLRGTRSLADDGAHRVGGLNPHRGKPGYLPMQAGIAAVLPHVDDLPAGHSLASFADLVKVVAHA
jgi:uncharacterized protein with von Willebrand factor type A (vWA) domain